MKPKVQEDPELKRQQLAAELEKVRTIQDRLSTQTEESLRYYGSRRALSGVGSSIGVPGL